MAEALLEIPSEERHTNVSAKWQLQIHAMLLAGGQAHVISAMAKQHIVFLVGVQDSKQEISLPGPWDQTPVWHAWQALL